MFTHTIFTRMNCRSILDKELENSAIKISKHVVRRVSEHLIDTMTIKDMQRILEKGNVDESKKLYLAVAIKTKKMILNHTNSSEKTFGIRVKNILQKIGIVHQEEPVTVNYVMYLQYYEKNVSEAQSFFRQFAQQYLEECKKNVVEAEKKFNTCHSTSHVFTKSSFQKDGIYWIFEDKYDGSEMHAVISALCNDDSDDESYTLFTQLAVLGSSTAIFLLNTANNVNNQQIVLSHIFEYEWVIGKIKHAYDNDESWIIDLETLLQSYSVLICIYALIIQKEEEARCEHGK